MRLIFGIKSKSGIKGNKKLKRLNNNKAVTPLIGMALAFAIISMLLSIMQIQMVPNLCKSQEASNSDYLIKTMSRMTEELTAGQQASAVFDTAHYQRYPMLMYPPTPPIVLKTENYNLTLDYTTTLPNGSILHKIVKIPTERVIVYADYFFYPKLKLMFENTALFKFTSGFNQTLITPALNNKTKILRIVEIIGKSNTISTTSPVTLTLSSVETGSFYANKVNLTFQSKYPEGWKNYGIVNGNNVTIKVSNVKVIVYKYVLSIQNINSTTQNSQYLSQNITLIPLNRFNMYNLSPGSSVSLGVKAVNDLFMPVSNVSILIGVNNSTVGSVSPVQTKTWSDGTAISTFTAKNPGVCKVKFSSDYGNVIYIIRVLGSNTSGWWCPHCGMMGGMRW